MGLSAPMRLAACVMLAGLAVSACGADGAVPRRADLGADPDGRPQSTPVYQLRNLDDPYADWFIAPERGLFVESGRLYDIVTCEAEGFDCIAWPFAFSFPSEGAPSMAGWQAGGYSFAARYETERDFCGRVREAWMIEGTDGSGLATRTWYHPDFGIYAILVGQAEDGRLVRIERAYSTCEAGLYARSR